MSVTAVQIDEALVTLDTWVTIYALRDPDTMDLRYIGKAVDVQARFRAHLQPGQLNRYRTHKNSWLKGLIAAGRLPLLEIVDEVRAEKANEAECYWIAWYLSQGAPLTNGTAGGDGGAVTDPEVRARITAIHKGRVVSPETRARQSATMKARCDNDAERERLRSISNGTPPVHHGEKNPRAKLSDVQVKTLRERAAAGERMPDLAAEYGITPASVTQLVTGQSRRAAGGPTRDPKPVSRLSEADVAEIRRFYGIGVNQGAIARRFSLSQGYVSDVINHQRRHKRPAQGGI